MPDAILRLCTPTDADYQDRVRALGRRLSELPEAIETAARAVVRQVRAEGDRALRELTFRFEKRHLTTFELSPAEWAAQSSSVAGAVRTALERAAVRIRAFAERERDNTVRSFQHEADGIRLASRVTALDRVGLYVPGGTARYPSTVLMTAIPARVAGVREIIMTTPGPSPETLAAAAIAGVDRVFVLGGAQAIAALAYGTESVPRVDKIVGPGNAYVTAAKRLVYGDVGIDFLAGPTEVAVAADATANPAWVAADLLAQAEHDALSVPILIAVGRGVAEAVIAQLQRQIERLPRRAIAERALRDQGLAIVVETPAQALELLSRIAPEHAGVALEDAAARAEQVVAGAVFVGHHASESVGDYMAGPSHVLPTGGSARFCSPLGVSDFQKRTSIIEYSAAALEGQIDDIVALAEVEGLSGHGRAVAARREEPSRDLAPDAEPAAGPSPRGPGPNRP
jgi:histidinol dehydrogenase